jgi:hypothetical protein
MFSTLSTQRRSWLTWGWLIAIAAGALVAALNIYAGMLLIALVVASMVPLLLPQMRSQSPRVVGVAPKTGAAEWPATVRRAIYTPDGDERPAFVVPAESAPGYQAVLTSAGYKLVNDAGQIVYGFKG